MITVSALGPIHAGGGTMFVAVTAPNTAVGWFLTGPGTLTPSSGHTDAAGVVSARYDAPADAANQSITVRAECYA